MPGDMRIFSLIVAGLLLLLQLHPAKGAIYRRYLCKQLEGRCEINCLIFEEKIGGCRADLTPLCCRKRKKN
ncbi:beta-defensin 13-like [Psammomys obesus]|uniref:beta-defensin 13-like n=1 Tax=Psammomys obesus TaxID=48139 RepID=UPI002452A8DE|nr:beta-defensin 13-like [Psammomys obesus]